MIPDNGVILVFTDAGSIGLELENSIAKKARRKNVKIFFALLAAINRGTGKPVRKIIEKLLLSKNLTYRPPLAPGASAINASLFAFVGEQDFSCFVQQWAA